MAACPQVSKVGFPCQEWAGLEASGIQSKKMQQASCWAVVSNLLSQYLPRLSIELRGWCCLGDSPSCG